MILSRGIEERVSGVGYRVPGRLPDDDLTEPWYCVNSITFGPAGDGDESRVSGPCPGIRPRPPAPVYLRILATTPAPTVRPPSRMAKRRPSSMAIGVMSSMVIWTLSPGMTISIPSGSSTDPVTSVVRK